MVKVILLLLGFGFIGFLITFAISKFTKNKIIKYIPTLIPLYFMIMSLFEIQKSTEGFSDIANFLLFILFTAVFLGMIITGIVIDIRTKKHQN